MNNQVEISFAQTREEIVSFICSLYCTENIITKHAINSPKDALNALETYTNKIERNKDSIFSIAWLTARFTKDELVQSGFYVDGIIEQLEPIASNSIFLFGETKFLQHYGDKRHIKIRVFDNAEIDLQVTDSASVIVEAFDNAKIYVECSNFSNVTLISESESIGYVALSNQSQAIINQDDKTDCTIELFDLAVMEGSISGSSKVTLSTPIGAPATRGYLKLHGNSCVEITTDSSNILTKTYRDFTGILNEYELFTA